MAGAGSALKARLTIGNNSTFLSMQSSQSGVDPFYGHEATANLCARFITHLFASPEYPPSPSVSQAKLPYFIAYALHRTKLHSSVTFAALVLLQRLKARFPTARGSSGHRLFISAFMTASKVICDDTYSNKSWAVIAQGMFALREINQMEREMCNYLDWGLHVDDRILSNFEARVKHDFRDAAPPSGYPTYPLQMVSRRAAINPPHTYPPPTRPPTAYHRPAQHAPAQQTGPPVYVSGTGTGNCPSLTVDAPQEVDILIVSSSDSYSSPSRYSTSDDHTLPTAQQTEPSVDTSGTGTDQSLSLPENPRLLEGGTQTDYHPSLAMKLLSLPFFGIPSHLQKLSQRRLHNLFGQTTWQIAVVISLEALVIGGVLPYTSQNQVAPPIFEFAVIMLLHSFTHFVVFMTWRQTMGTKWLTNFPNNALRYWLLSLPFVFLLWGGFSIFIGFVVLVAIDGGIHTSSQSVVLFDTSSTPRLILVLVTSGLGIIPLMFCIIYAFLQKRQH